MKTKVVQKVKIGLYFSKATQSRLKQHCAKPSVSMSMSEFVDRLVRDKLGIR